MLIVVFVYFFFISNISFNYYFLIFISTLYFFFFFFSTNAIQQFVSSFPRTELKNRNLLRVTSDSTEARLKMLFMGKGDIFKRRSELPKFTMDASTLKVDTFVMNPIKNAYPFVTVWIFLYGEMKLEQETKTKSIASSTFGFSRTIQLKAIPENQYLTFSFFFLFSSFLFSSFLFFFFFFFFLFSFLFFSSLSFLLCVCFDRYLSMFFLNHSFIGKHLI